MDWCAPERDYWILITLLKPKYQIIITQGIYYSELFWVRRSNSGRHGDMELLRERKYLQSFKMWCWRRMKKIKWSEKVINEQVLERIREKRTFINNILCIKFKWFGHIIRRNGLLWKTDDTSEISSKNKNTVHWWFEKKMFAAEGGSWRSKKIETTLYQSNI